VKPLIREPVGLCQRDSAVQEFGPTEVGPAKDLPVIFSAWKAVLAGEAQRLRRTNGDGQPARKDWEKSARPTLDAAVQKLSDIPFEEVRNMRRTREGRVKQKGKDPEVSGGVLKRLLGSLAAAEGPGLTSPR
jgi:hypothetical protein